MEITWVPEVCKGESKTFDGSLQIKLLAHKERLRVIAKCRFELSSAGLETRTAETLEGLAIALDHVEKQVTSVSLKHIPSGKEFKSFEEMSYDTRCDVIMNELAGAFLAGFPMGNA